MAYMCIKGRGECDGCMDCYPKPKCKHCGELLTDDEFEKYEDECKICHDYYFEESALDEEEYDAD